MVNITFFRPLIGCDTTSAFASRGKRSAWDIWNALPEITSTFECILTDEMLYLTTKHLSYETQCSMTKYFCKGARS